MMKGKLAGVLIAVGALHSSVSLALGLGNMTVHSSLNQPLSADIKLVDVGDLNPDQIRVSLASPKEFERAGVDRVFFLNNLHFDVVTSHGKFLIKVTSDKLVREPYLDFVLQVSWPSGRILRDYTVLVDLPKSAATAPTPSTSSSSQATATAYRQSGQPTSRTVSSTEGASRLPGGVSGDKVRVQRNATLWGLSERVKPQDATVQQTMLALQQANPQAFLRKNINGLQAGRVLRVPSEEEIHAVSRQQAVREVARQNHAWANGVASAGKRQLEGGKQNAAAGGAAPSSSGYMRLASGGGGTGDSAGSKDGDKAAALSEQLTAAQENLDSAKRENADLSSRVSDLNKQIDTLKKLVELKNGELATLQAQLAKSGKAGQTAAASATTGTASAAATGTKTGSEEEAASATAPVPTPGGNDTGAAASGSNQPAEAETSQPAKPETRQPPKVTVKQPPPSPSLLEKLTSNPMYEGLAVALVALLGFGWWYLRRNRAEELDNDHDFLGTYEGESTVDAEPAETLVTTEAVGEQTDEDMAAETAEATGETRPSTGDAVAEAEVYRSYGRDDESRALLVTALQSEPERNDVRLKLMEYQVADGDRDGFREQYRALMDRREHTALAAAAALLAGGVVVGDWLEGLDVVEAEPAAPETAAAPEAAEATDDTLDFDLDLESPAGDLDATRPREALDLDHDMETALDNEAETDAVDDNDTGIDFSLDTTLETPAGDTADTDDTADTKAASADEPLEFDLSDLDLDVGDEAGALSADDVDLDFSSEIERSSEDQAGEIATNVDATAEREALDIGAGNGAEAKAEDDFDLDLGDLDVDTATASASTDAAAGSEIDTAAAMHDLDSLLQSDDDGDLEGLGDADEVATKLDLARAYIDMGDVDGAREILDEVMAEGSDDQKEEASSLLANMTG